MATDKAMAWSINPAKRRIDVSDAYAMTPRKVDFARLDAETGRVAFSQFEWPTEGAGAVARLVGSLGHDKSAFIVDGPQALAGC